MESAHSALEFLQATRSSLHQGCLNGKWKPSTGSRWHTIPRYSSSFRTNSGIVTSSSCTLTISGDTIRSGWILNHVILHQDQASCTWRWRVTWVSRSKVSRKKRHWRKSWRSWGRFTVRTFPALKVEWKFECLLLNVGTLVIGDIRKGLLTFSCFGSEQ